jgi:hypothetical protein
MPVIIPITYYFLLPHNTAFLFSHTPESYEDEISPSQVVSGLPYTPLREDDDPREEEGILAPGPKRKVALTLDDKLRLVQPLLLKYMLPLCKLFAVHGYLMIHPSSSSLRLPSRFIRSYSNELRLLIQLLVGVHY